MPIRTLMRHLAPALALAALCLTSTAHAGPGWWGDLDKGKTVSLSDVMARPTQFSQKQITFTCISSGKANVHFQESAILSKQRYTNYAVWPDGAVVWNETDYKSKDFPFLYIAKNHFQHDALLGLRKFTHIEVTGRVKAVLRNKAHIEVSSFRETSFRLGWDTFDDMRHGGAYVTSGHYDLAAERFERALRADLPPKYDLLVRKELASVYRSLGREADARRVAGGHGILSGRDFQKPKDPNQAFGGPDGAPAAGNGKGSEPFPEAGFPPLDDELPGTPQGSNGLGAPPAGPAPTRTERVNPFLDEDLPGTSPGVVPVRPRQPNVRRPGTGVDPTLDPMRPATRTPNPGTPIPGTPIQGNPVSRPADVEPGFAPADDLPGLPANPGANPPPAVPVPGTPLPGNALPGKTGATPPPAPTTPPAAAPTRRTGRSVKPPKRRPRLAGVK